MNTDPPIGSSGDATPTELTDRLNANLDYRATRLSFAPPPLSDILHRSRRRQNRRHAAGVLAGAGALALSGVAIVARPQPGADLVTQTAGGNTPGTVGTTVPAAELGLQANAADDRCPNPGTWYLGLRASGTDKPGFTPVQVDTGTWVVPAPPAELNYAGTDQSVTITVQKATHDQYLLHLLERTWGRPERRQIRGEDGWIMAHDGQPADLAIWYDPGRGAFATVAASTPTGVAAPGQLDRVLDQVADLDAGEVSALCSRIAAQRAADAAAVAVPATTTTGPWTAPADGSSSPWTTSPGDGSSSPWTASTLVPAHDDHGGSPSPRVDPLATTRPAHSLAIRQPRRRARSSTCR